MGIWKGIEMILCPLLFFYSLSIVPVGSFPLIVTTRWHLIFQASRIHALDKDFHPQCFKCEVGIKIYPQHIIITTTLVETIETRRTAGWCWTRGWRGRSAGRSGSTCSASSATGGGRTRVSPRRVMRSEQQWSESQLEQKWCSLGRRRRGGTCLMSRSHRNLTTNLKSLLLQEDNRHWLAKYPKIPTLCTNSFW